MSFSFDAKQGLIIVRTKLYGINGDTIVRLALDTGATATMINADILALLGYTVLPGSKRVRMTTGSGVEFVPLIHMSRLRALGKERKNFPVVSHTLPPSATVDGLLGLDFLRGRELRIDFRNEQITL